MIWICRECGHRNPFAAANANRAVRCQGCNRTICEPVEPRGCIVKVGRYTVREAAS
ncbi:MAG: hypothetical protein WC683_15030 [bacterium]